MRVFCPSCSEPINISDDLAGKTTVCPLCKATFAAPSLFSSGTANPDSSVHTQPESAAYQIATEPPAPAPPRPASASGAAAQTSAPAAAVFTTPAYVPPPPPPRERESSERPSAAAPTGHTRSCGFSFSPEIVQWAAPVCLGLAVLLTFFSWNGAYPGGHAVYTQGPWRALFGHIGIDPVGEKVLHMNPGKPAEGKTRLEDDVHMNWLMFLYLPLLIATFALSVFFTLLPKLSIQIPPNLRQIEPWRMLVIAGLSLFLTALVGLQCFRGFGLENALRESVKADGKEQLDNPSDEDIQKNEIIEGQALGSLGVRYTTALDFTIWLQSLAAVGAAATFVMNRRTDRPAPRVEFRW
jgi:hypothetical protein